MVLPVRILLLLTRFRATALLLPRFLAGLLLLAALILLVLVRHLYVSLVEHAEPTRDRTRGFGSDMIVA